MKLLISRVIGSIAWLGFAVLMGLFLMIPFRTRGFHRSEYLSAGIDFNQWANSSFIQSPFQITWWGFAFWGSIVVIAICLIPEMLHRSRTWLRLRAVSKGGCLKCRCIIEKPVDNCPQCNAVLSEQQNELKKLRRRMKWTNIVLGLVISLGGWVMVAGLVMRIIGEVAENPIP